MYAVSEPYFSAATKNTNILKITFLGTGTSQGIPVIGCDCAICTSPDPKDKRLRTSVLIEHHGQCTVIDVGPDFRQQMLAAQAQRVDRILLTHEHTDHINGLDDVRPFNFRYRMDMPVYGAQRTLDVVQDRFGYIFEAHPYPGAPRVMLHPITADDTLHFDGLDVTPIHYLHYKMPVMGYRLGDFTYLTDIKTISDTELAKAQGTHTLVISALRHGPHYSHLNLAEALDLIALIRPQRAYLTHLSHKMGTHIATERLLPPHIRVAYDGLSIEL